MNKTDEHEEKIELPVGKASDLEEPIERRETLRGKNEIDDDGN